jgi:hypothetical protein
MTETTKLCPQCGSVHALTTLVCTRCKAVLKMPPNSSYWTYGLKRIGTKTEIETESESESEFDLESESESMTIDEVHAVRANKQLIRKGPSVSLRALAFMTAGVIVLWGLLLWAILCRPI